MYSRQGFHCCSCEIPWAPCEIDFALSQGSGICFPVICLCSGPWTETAPLPREGEIQRFLVEERVVKPFDPLSSLLTGFGNHLHTKVHHSPQQWPHFHISRVQNTLQSILSHTGGVSKWCNEHHNHVQWIETDLLCSKFRFCLKGIVKPLAKGQTCAQAVSD